MNGTATVRTVEPGDGWRYVIVSGTTEDGTPFVACPTLGVAAIATPYPVEAGYLQHKLGVSADEAKIIFDALNPHRVKH